MIHQALKHKNSNPNPTVSLESILMVITIRKSYLEDGQRGGWNSQILMCHSVTASYKNLRAATRPQRGFKMLKMLLTSTHGAVKHWQQSQSSVFICWMREYWTFEQKQQHSWDTKLRKVEKCDSFQAGKKQLRTHLRHDCLLICWFWMFPDWTVLVQLCVEVIMEGPAGLC